MAENSLLSITPHQVSRDLRGYSVMFYGDPKSGKTTTATKFPNHLLLGFEKGWNAIPGAMPKPINSWADFKKTLRELKDPAVKARFETIIIDTLDIAYDYAEKYVCANAQVDKIGDIPYGGGYALLEKEFDECLRSIVKMDYGLVMISHATDKVFKDENGQEYNMIVPTLDKRATKITTRMADIIGYSRAVTNSEDGTLSTKLFMRGTPRFMAGSRFKYTPDYIDFSYQNLVDAICEAIDKQAEEDGSEFFTNERSNLNYVEELDFDKLVSEFNKIVDGLISSHSEEEFINNYQPKITEIIERYLGKGVKVNDCSRTQVEAISLIVDDLKTLIK